MATHDIERQSFRVSTGLKDLIGRDLITDDLVAVFELVKNSFDAHAHSVRIRFEPDRLVISDDGKGMSREDILKKWLFVAYSAKREGTEDADYRDVVEDRQRPYAGAKGVGRFSCDRLGTQLILSSRAKKSNVQVLHVDWTKFEENHADEFTNIEVELTEQNIFPDESVAPSSTGTVLDIRNLRAPWDRHALEHLKRELTKLIDPFSGDEAAFRISIEAPEEAEQDAINHAFNESRREDQNLKIVVNGEVQNPILDVLSERTTSIDVRLVEDGTKIETLLEDRGELVYRIREPNPYPLLSSPAPKATVYFLNRSAKVIFARRMGLPSIRFGSVFLFRNGFRVFPIGSEDDDFFGLNKRKQQGQRRYLGGRDVIGRVDVKGVPGFDEATSRNQGLIRTPGVDSLVEFVVEKCVRRLERYVVDISWKDAFDKDVETSERMKLDTSSARISSLLSKLAAAEGVEVLEYNPDLVRIVDEKSEEFESSLKALELLAEKTGDTALMTRVEQARHRLSELESSEREAREAEQRAVERASRAEADASRANVLYGEERDRNRFLVAAASLDQDTILNLHHQIIIHASDVHNEIKLLIRRLRNGTPMTAESWLDALQRMSYRNSQILTAARFATKGGYKLQSSETTDDLALYFHDYIENVASIWARGGVKVLVNWDEHAFTRRFKPIEIGIVIDNLVSNAEKARASTIRFHLSAPSPSG